jgi:SAM-dependent methyltransferase
MKGPEMDKRQEWFGEWFNSPYYHILYKDRGTEEAKGFIDNLSSYLEFKPTDKIMDLACGKGRHAIYLNKKGFEVEGIDLSEKNIQEARKFAHEKLRFFVHDMRKPYKENKFDFVLNMFTSFGYFETQEENSQVIHTVFNSLKSGGKFLLDFLNPYKVINNLQASEVKIVNGIKFEIHKSFKDGFIQKDIRFNDQDKAWHFNEKVKAIRQSEFLDYFEEASFKLLKVFGDYSLNNYEKEDSERMIFLLEKP